MSRPHRCDVPGCGNTRRRWQRICEQCFLELPRDVRTGIIENHRFHRRAQWRAFCKLAGPMISQIRERRQATIAAQFSPPCKSWSRPSAQAAFERTQRMLGERD